MMYVIKYEKKSLTPEQENAILRELIRKMTLDEYVAFWNVVGQDKLNKILSS